MELRALPLSPTDLWQVPRLSTRKGVFSPKGAGKTGSICWPSILPHAEPKNQVKMDHRRFTNYITNYLLWCQEHNWQKKNEYVGLLSKIKNSSVILIRARRAWVLGPSVMLTLENLIYQTFYVCSFWHKHIPLVMRKKDMDSMKFRGNLSWNVTSWNASWLPSPWPQNSWRGCIFS